MSDKPADTITPEQQAFYDRHRQSLVNRYLQAFPTVVDPDTIRDLFTPIGYNRSNVQGFQAITKKLTEEIFYDALKRNAATVNKVIFAAGLPATGKSTHLRLVAQDALVYDGTINNEEKFLRFVQAALDAGYEAEVFVYSAAPARAFRSNLERGNRQGRYVPVSQYEKWPRALMAGKNCCGNALVIGCGFVISSIPVMKATRPRSFL